MLNTLRVDFRRYLMTKSFMALALIAAVLQPLFTELIIWGSAKLFQQNIAVSMSDLAIYTNMAAIYLAVFVTLFLYAEAGEGIIRNKLISGKKRTQVLVSYSLVNAFWAAVLQVLSAITPVLMGLVTGAELQMSSAEVIRFIAVSTLSGMAISIFYTVVYLSFCTNKVSVAIPGTIAAAMYISLIIITDALYTSSGIPKVSGMTLRVYEGIDRFCSFAHLTGELRWDNASYIIGDVALILISLLAGSAIFARKDMK